MPESSELSQLTPLLTSKQLAAILRVPISTVYAWQSRKTGPPAFRVGRHTRYRSEDVEAWLERRAAVP